MQLIQNEIHKSIELETLDLMLKVHEWREVMLQETIISWFRLESFDSYDLARWASALVKRGSGSQCCREKEDEPS